MKQQPIKEQLIEIEQMRIREESAECKTACMKYLITATYEETLYREVEAKNKKEAIKKAKQEWDNGEDFETSQFVDIRTAHELKFEIENLCPKCKENTIAEGSINKSYPAGSCKGCYDIGNQ